MTAIGIQDSGEIIRRNWNAGDVADPLEFAIVIETTAVGGTTPTFSAAVQVAPDSGAFAAPVAIVTEAITGAGRTVLIVERDDVINALAGALVGSLRLYLTLGGTSPTITYTAYCAPLPGM